MLGGLKAAMRLVQQNESIKAQEGGGAVLSVLAVSHRAHEPLVLRTVLLITNAHKALSPLCCPSMGKVFESKVSARGCMMLGCTSCACKGVPRYLIICLMSGVYN